MLRILFQLMAFILGHWAAYPYMVTYSHPVSIVLRKVKKLVRNSELLLYFVMCIEKREGLKSPSEYKDFVVYSVNVATSSCQAPSKGPVFACKSFNYRFRPRSRLVKKGSFFAGNVFAKSSPNSLDIFGKAGRELPDFFYSADTPSN